VRFETEPGSRHRSITANSKSLSASSRRRYICSYSPWAIRGACLPRGYRNERLTTLLDGHERAFRWFGGVTLSCLYDNPRTLVLGRSESQVLWHPWFEDFARYYGLHRTCARRCSMKPDLLPR
jgi:transposase